MWLPAWFDRLPHTVIERTIVTCTFVLVLLLVLQPVARLTLTAMAAPAQPAMRRLSLTCHAFPSQEAAQAYFRAHPEALALDGNRDGIACNANPPPRDLTPVPR